MMVHSRLLKGLSILTVTVMMVNLILLMVIPDANPSLYALPPGISGVACIAVWGRAKYQELKAGILQEDSIPEVSN